jgi:hypothetical protein
MACSRLMSALRPCTLPLCSRWPQMKLQHASALSGTQGARLAPLGVEVVEVHGLS